MVSRLDTYHWASNLVSESTRGATSVLDFGNGGFIGYDISESVRYLLAVDICIVGARKEIVKNAVVEFVEGDVLAWTDERRFDLVIAQNLLHHIVGRKVSDNIPLVRKAVRAMWRNVACAGKLLVVESVLPFWALSVERVLYPFSSLLVPVLFDHPVTYQLSLDILAEHVLSCCTGGVLAGIGIFPVGKWIIHYGHMVPTWLTPARLAYILIRRDK